MKIDVQSLVESNNSFAFDLYSKFSESEGNLCISPFSIYTALAMTFAGARSSTEKQMKDVMHTSLTQDEFHKGFSQLLEQISKLGQEKNIELLLANSIYPHDKYVFLEAFITNLKKDYKTEITPIDYSKPETARKTINQWVDEKTQEHIPELISAGILNQLTRLVLVNAIYFKGFWEKQFDRHNTAESPFWILPDHSVPVPMMHQKAGFRYIENKQVQILDLPYQGKNFSLVIVLPKDGLSNIERSFTSDHVSKWMTGLHHETVDVRLPLFNIKSSFALNDTLISMGMPDAFDMDKADFSGMDGTRDLYISDTLHQANIEVNEEGATATAATAVVIAVRGMPQEYQFHANHPFIFLLRENTTGSILFIGRIQNPLE
jgi:serpin B